MANEDDRQPHEAILAIPALLVFPQPSTDPGDDPMGRHVILSHRHGHLEGEADSNSSLDPSRGVLARGDLIHHFRGDTGDATDAWYDAYRSYCALSARESHNRDSPIPLVLDGLPNELLLHILSFLDVCDLLATSRTSHHLRALSLAPILHHHRLRRTRIILPPLLYSPARPSLADLIRRSIFLTHTTVVSRKLGRSLAAIRLSHRLAARPPASALIERCVLPAECAPGTGHVAPAIVAKKRAVEKERVKDGLRRWVDVVWRGEVRQRSEGVRRWEERVGVGRVWRLRKFWERIGSQS